MHFLPQKTFANVFKFAVFALPLYVDQWITVKPYNCVPCEFTCTTRTNNVCLRKYTANKQQKNVTHL